MVDWAKELENEKKNELSVVDGWYNQEIIEVKGNTIFILEGYEDKLAEFLELQDKFERAKRQIIDDIKKASSGKSSMSCDSTKVNISYTPARIGTRFNSTRFKRDHPELYEEYCDESETAESVRISLKQQKLPKRYIVKDGVIIDNETGEIITEMEAEK